MRPRLEFFAHEVNTATLPNTGTGRRPKGDLTRAFTMEDMLTNRNQQNKKSTRE
jgi:hypothetical protein